MNPCISKCNGKRCSCCKHLCCKSTIKSNVNGRRFSVVTYSDLNLRSANVFMFYLEKRKIVAYHTCRFLKTRFSEHSHQMKNPHKTDNFLYRHFKQTNHSPSYMFIQHVVKIIYESHST